MALPTVWQLLIPQFSIVTIIGVVMILLGIFKGTILNAIGWVFEKLSGGLIKTGSLRWAFIGGGTLMVWLPNVITQLFKTTEGILVFVSAILFIIALMIAISLAQDDDTKGKDIF